MPRRHRSESGRGKVTGKEGSLRRVEHDRFDVGKVDGCVVDDGEVRVPVLLCGRLGRLGEREPDGDREVAALGDGLVEVGAVVVLALGLQPHGAHAVLLLSGVESGENGLVEALVVESSEVGHHAGDEVGVLAAVTVRGGRRGGTAGEADCCESREGEGCDQTRAAKAHG